LTAATGRAYWNRCRGHIKSPAKGIYIKEY
jgi:hypothetical protein